MSLSSPTVTMTTLIALGRLIRLPLATMVALSALAAALAANPMLPWLTVWALGWGIFLLAAACSVLNQVAERFTDALMTRTCHRPLAGALLTARTGTLIGATLGSAGLMLLSVTGGVISALLGLTAMAWYLLVYTPMKRISSLAVIAGTPCGILPLLIGWQVGDAPLFAPQVMALALVMLLWQVPHFWLLSIPDRNELELAGFKLLPRAITNQRLLHLCHFWILAMTSCSLLLPLLGVVQEPVLQGSLVVLAAGFALWSCQLQARTVFIEPAVARLRVGLHLYLGLLLAILLFEGLLIRLTG
ncbi:MAG: protoheme IX farnesyltransferase [Desulfuromonas sp.]|nr:MAG: protoheme IX farnesyltransferase [Desulfuromonas sp.]